MSAIAIFPLAQWLEGTNQNSTPANDNALRVQAATQPAKGFASAAPGSPADYDQWIIGTTWGGFTTANIVIYLGGTWKEFASYDGMTKVVAGTKKIRVSGAWVTDSSGTGGGSIDLASQVWVETAGDDGTAAVGDPSKPYLTIDGALDATSGPLVINIGLGVFASPTNDYNVSSPTTVNPSTKMRANVWFKGTMCPALDDYTTPTELVGGTILTGEFVINAINTRNGTKLSDIGFDAGSVRHTMSGQDGFAVYNIGQVVGQAPVHGIEVDRCIALGASATNAAHGFAFENCIDPKVTDIATYYNLHGVAWKCIGGYLNGLISYGHNGDLLIVKEGNTGNASAPCNNTLLTNITGGCLSSGDTNYGIAFETAGPNDLKGILVSNVKFLTTFADGDLQFIIDGSATGGMHDIKIDGMQTQNAYPAVVVSGAVDKTKVRINGRLLDGEIPLTSGATVNTDASLGNNFRVVLGTNATLANPTNMVGGETYQWRIKQDGTGSRTLALGSKFKQIGGGSAPVFTTTANATDLISAEYSAVDDTLIYTVGKNAS